MTWGGGEAAPSLLEKSYIPRDKDKLSLSKLSILNWAGLRLK